MKSIYLLLLLAFVQNVNAQDFCKQIKKEVSEDKKVFDYTSPFDVNLPPAVRVSRSYSIDPDGIYDNFTLTLQVIGELESMYTKNAAGDQIEKDEQAVIVEFDDKTKYVDSIKISHDFTPDHAQVVRYVYLPLTDKNLNDFSAKKIAKISLAGYEQPVAADSSNAVLHYIQCLKTVK